MNTPNDRKSDELIALAEKALEGGRPSTWDTDAYDLWVLRANERHLLDDRSEADKRAAWMEALRAMRINHPADYKQYERLRKLDKQSFVFETINIEWGFALKSGGTDGQTYDLVLDILGEDVKLFNLTRDQITDPAYVIEVVQHETGKFNIGNPYSGADKNKWKIQVLMLWYPQLKKGPRQNPTDMIGEVIKDYGLRKMVESGAASPFKQTDKAVRREEDGLSFIYIPSKGIRKYANKTFDKNLAERTLTNALVSLGFQATRKGEARSSWWRILEHDLYGTNTIAGETGVGEKHPPDFDVAPGRDVEFDQFYEQERGRPAEKSSHPLPEPPGEGD